jgi:lantibiotic transport system permease protein
MKALLRLFRAERIKWRRNWLLVLALLIPVCQVFFLFEIFWFSEVQVNRMGPGFPAWYFINHSAWNVMFMPILAALVAALSWEMEEDCAAWKHLLLQPINRSAQYVAKLVSHLALLGLAQVLFASLLLLGGLLLRSRVPNLQMGPVHPELVVTLTLASLLALLPVVSLHTWLSTRFPGVMSALVTTLGGTWLTLHLAGTTSLVYGSPWFAASQASELVQRSGHLPWIQCLVGVACALTFLVIGYFDFLPHKNKQI